MIQGQQRRLQVVQRRINRLDIVHDVTLRNEKILPSVIVKIFQTHPPPGISRRNGAYTRFAAAIREQAVTVIVVHGINLFCQVCHNDVGQSVVIVVAEVRAHSRERLSILGQRNARLVGNLRERAVAVIVKQKLLHAVVRHEYVGKSIAVIIVEGHPERPSLFGRDARTPAYIFKRPVPAITVQHIRYSGKLTRRAIRFPHAASAMRRVPLHVTSYKQIQMPVIVEIQPPCGGGPPACRHARLCCHIHKSAVAVIVVQNILAVARDVQIRVAVIVVIACGYAHAVIAFSRIREPRLFRHVRKTSIPVLPEQPVPIPGIASGKLFRRLHRIPQLTAIHQEHVKQPVIVIVKQRHTPAHRLDQMFLQRRRVLMDKRQSAILAHLKQRGSR